MQPTTRPAISALESIHPELLFHVSGGCHKPRCSSPQAAPAPVQPSPLPQLLPTAPGQPAPQAQAATGGDSVTTSVTINGQPQATA